MNRLPKTLIALSFGCASALTGLRLYTGSWLPFDAQSGASATETNAAQRPGFRIGRAYRYDVQWSQESVASSKGAAAAGLGEELRGNLALEAVIRLEPRANPGDGLLVNVTLESVKRASVTLQGQDLLADDMTRQTLLAPREVEAELSTEGELLELRLPKDTPELYAQLVEGVLLQLQDTGGKALGGEERAPDGVFATRYEAAPDGSSLSRKRTRAIRLESLDTECDGACTVSLEGGARLSFNDDGELSRIEDEEAVRAAAPGSAPVLESKLRFVAELRSVVELSAPPGALAASDWGVKAAGEPWESAQTERALLEQRAAGMNMDRVVSGLDLAGSMGPESLPGGWLASTTAFLALHPELLVEIAVRFQNPDATVGMKTALLDLLAATGTAEAEQILCRLLDDVAANEDSAARLHFTQRTILIEAPEAETIDYLRRRFGASRADGDAELELATAHALGAAAGNAKTEGARQSAALASRELREALAASEQAPQRAGLLRALGNAGDDGAVSAVLQHVGDEDASVRAAAAAALRKTPSAEAQAALLSLATDTVEDVRLEALDALSTQPRTPELSRELAMTLAKEQAASPRTEGELVTLIAREKQLTPEARAALAAVLGRTTDNRLKARVKLMLARADQG